VKLAEEVAAERQAGLAKSWRNVTVLLECFGHGKLTPEARRVIHEALTAVDLVAVPSLLDDACDRSTKVRLLLEGESPDAAQDLVSEGLARATLWVPGKPPKDVALTSSARRQKGILWVELEPAAEVPAALSLLQPLLPDLSPEGLEDLLQVDDLPEAAAYGTTNRKISTIAVHAVESGGSQGLGKAGELVFETVELLVGDGWVVSCWHEPRGTAGKQSVGFDQPGYRKDAMEGIVDCWVRQHHDNAGALSILVFRELARTYVVARRTLYSWLEQWELEFHRNGARVEQATLADLRYLVSEFQRRLNSLNESRAVVAEHSWFPESGSNSLESQLDNLLDRSIEGLIAFSGMVRSAVDLLTTAGIREQLRLAHVSAEKAEKLQDQLGLVAAVLLVPTFIAGLFGANTEVPGQGHWSGFVGMLALMVVGSFGTYWFLRRAKDRQRAAADELAARDQDDNGRAPAA
jgi:hypothetical protein